MVYISNTYPTNLLDVGCWISELHPYVVVKKRRLIDIRSFLDPLVPSTIWTFLVCRFPKKSSYKQKRITMPHEALQLPSELRPSQSSVSHVGLSIHDFIANAMGRNLELLFPSLEVNQHLAVLALDGMINIRLCGVTFKETY
mgnify:CR=1 FL=1